jgi:hypothetical protein
MVAKYLLGATVWLLQFLYDLSKGLVKERRCRHE